MNDESLDRTPTGRPEWLRSNGTQTTFVAIASVLCLAVAGCGSSPQSSGKKVKFSSEKYGVPASPKVVADGQSVPVGGGRQMVGKPYKVAGKWYKPRHDPNYTKVGMASWYGPTFHGRMTANGEVFDRNRLSAAHTTMPLPSYAKVTNLENGRSIIVRVNDRGPFHGNRVIDLSERVATMLDFKRNGTAKVKVDYVGPARLDGRDHDFLMASYEGPGAVTPGGTMPGTLLARAPTPPAAVSGPAPVPRDRPYDVPVQVARASAGASSTITAAFDPALAFEASEKTVQIASANTFVPQVQAALSAAAPASTPANRPAAEPSATQPADQPAASSQPQLAPGPGILGVLPVDAPAPAFAPGGAVSSYAANIRIAATHALAMQSNTGLSLRQLTVAAVE